jgi:hypothetical protein
VSTISICGIISYAAEYTPFRSFFKRNTVVTYLKPLMSVIMLGSFIGLTENVWHYYIYSIGAANIFVSNDSLLLCD